jgi:N6-L-threonylcarbamoyladenine synthase
MNKDNIILGIESSCDDTSVAIISNNKVLANITAGQEVHEKYGGVVPELASRAHQQNIVPVIDAALKAAHIELKDLDAIAFTKGPGLLGSLLVGTTFAKSLSLSLKIPLIGVNHMKGHILAHFIDEKGKEKPTFPFICLTVSGGHTQLVKVTAPLEMKVLGETIDDAAGEAFDKAAKLLGLPYPGGPLIDKYAQLGDKNKFEFTLPNAGEYNYSFSGLKTQFMNFLRKGLSTNENFIEENLNDICASYQAHIINYLFKNLKKIAFKEKINQIAIAGGVSANSYLRKELQLLGEKHGWKTFIPEFQYCTDNAGMIAVTGYYQFLEKDFCNQDVTPNPRMKVEE